MLVVLSSLTGVIYELYKREGQLICHKHYSVNETCLLVTEDYEGNDATEVCESFSRTGVRVFINDVILDIKKLGIYGTIPALSSVGCCTITLLFGIPKLEN
ncbi:hypothetical protein C0J52_23997 [Blattella germanica]|nr:hypothetical protein C0J52_23997 [Blattella germanica]